MWKKLSLFDKSIEALMLTIEWRAPETGCDPERMAELLTVADLEALVSICEQHESLSKAEREVLGELERLVRTLETRCRMAT